MPNTFKVARSAKSVLKRDRNSFNCHQPEAQIDWNGCVVHLSLICASPSTVKMADLPLLPHKQTCMHMYKKTK